MYISSKTGAVSYSDAVKISPQTTLEEAQRLRASLNTSFPNVKSDIRIFFPGEWGAENGLGMDLRFSEGRLIQVILSVPWKSDVPDSMEKQLDYLVECVGTEFLDKAIEDDRDGVFPWGKVSMNWNNNSAVMSLCLRYRQQELP